MDIQFHFIRQHVESNTIQLFYCSTREMTADVFTKARPRPQFNKHTVTLGLGVSSNYMSGKFQKLNLPGKEILAQAGLERIPRDNVAIRLVVVLGRHPDMDTKGLHHL